MTQRSPRARGATTWKVAALAIAGSLMGMPASAVPAMAVDSGSVDAQVTVARAAACLEVSVTSVGFGTLALGAENAAGTPEIVVTNCGDGDEALFASGTNATGASATWTLVDSAETCADTLGTNRYHLGLATPAGTSIARLSTENTELGTLSADESATHVARISTACPGSSGAGETLDMQINYLVTNVDGPPVTLEELTMSQATAEAAASFLFGGTQDIAIPANCAGTVTVGCVGGVPAVPAPSIHMVNSSLGVTEVTGAARWDVTARATAATIEPIPVTVSGTACQLTVDTSAGANSDVVVAFQMLFRSHPDPNGPKNYIGVVNTTLSGLTVDDLTLSGGIACSAADFAMAFMIGQLTDVIAASLQRNVCGDPGGDSFITCPALQ